MGMAAERITAKLDILEYSIVHCHYVVLYSI
jgi:hypothetical protein